MNFDSRCRTMWFRMSFENSCRVGVVLLKQGGSSKGLVALSDDATAWGQRPWTPCGGQPVALLSPQTPNLGLLQVHFLQGRNCTHLRKLRFLVVPIVVDFIKEICCNICKIYEFIKIVTGRKASCSFIAWWIFISVYFNTIWRRVQVLIYTWNSRDRPCYSGNTVSLYSRPTGIVF
jgi:hypothetical protein